MKDDMILESKIVSTSSIAMQLSLYRIRFPLEKVFEENCWEEFVSFNTKRKDFLKVSLFKISNSDDSVSFREQRVK